jgi:uncharacterized protein YjbJ (UPF0337 family)
MHREEVEGKWDRRDEPIQGKWGKLTRAQRSAASGRRNSHYMKLHELYGISDEEAEEAIALENSALQGAVIEPPL